MMKLANVSWGWTPIPEDMPEGDSLIKIAHADALERALIRSICNHCMCDVICNGGDACFIAVNSQDLVAERAERLGYAFPKAANPDYGK